MKRLISKITHDYGQRTHKVGTQYDATDDHARFLVSRGVASYAEEKKPVPAAPTYKAASIQAEAPAAEPKKQYKTRNLTAE